MDDSSDCLYLFARDTDVTLGSHIQPLLTIDNADCFSGELQEVYIQWIKDPEDKLLVDGYFRNTMSNQELPVDVNVAIAGYYLKSFSLGFFGERLPNILKHRMNDKERRNREKREECKHMILYIFLGILVTSRDIAMLVINIQNECVLDTEGGRSEFFIGGLSEWMYCASITHLCIICGIVYIGILVKVFDRSIEYIDHDCELATVSCLSFLGWVFLVIWTFCGFGLHYEINDHGVNNQQCGDILLAWLILQYVLEVGPAVVAGCVWLIKMMVECRQVFKDG